MLGLVDKNTLSSYGLYSPFSPVVFSVYIMSIKWQQVLMKYKATMECM